MIAVEKGAGKDEVYPSRKIRFATIEGLEMTPSPLLDPQADVIINWSTTEEPIMPKKDLTLTDFINHYQHQDSSPETSTTRPEPVTTRNNEEAYRRFIEEALLGGQEKEEEATTQPSTSTSSTTSRTTTTSSYYITWEQPTALTSQRSSGYTLLYVIAIIVGVFILLSVASCIYMVYYFNRKKLARANESA